MWGIFWSVCWKSVLTWFVIAFALTVWAFVQQITTGEVDEETLVSNLMTLWSIIGVISCIVSFISLIVLVIISIWN